MNEASGTNCVFDPETGIKTYTSKEKCDFAFEAQNKAFLVGAAPKVLERIDDFSFRSEIADTSFFMENLQPFVLYNPIFPDLHQKLVPILKDNPYCTPCPEHDNIDLARHNLGLYEGRVVMLDFC